MAKLGSLIKLAALASLVPYQFEMKEDGKSFSASALLWKVDHKAASEDKEGSTSITIPGNLKDVAEKVKRAMHREEQEETEAEFRDCTNEKNTESDHEYEEGCACEEPCKEDNAEGATT